VLVRAPCIQDLLPYCYRCSSNNPLISSARNGDCCVNCGHPFIRTFSTFDPLPLVKFVPEGMIACVAASYGLFGLASLLCAIPRFTTAGISDEEAIKLIAMDPLASAPVTATPQVPEKKRKGVVAQDSWKQSASGGAETLTFSDAPAAAKKTDPFEELLTGLDVRAFLSWFGCWYWRRWLLDRTVFVVLPLVSLSQRQLHWKCPRPCCVRCHPMK
jgi:hypothetical protein